MGHVSPRPHISLDRTVRRLGSTARNGRTATDPEMTLMTLVRGDILTGIPTGTTGTGYPPTHPRNPQYIEAFRLRSDGRDGSACCHGRAGAEGVAPRATRRIGIRSNTSHTIWSSPMKNPRSTQNGWCNWSPQYRRSNPSHTTRPAIAGVVGGAGEMSMVSLLARAAGAGLHGPLPWFVPVGRLALQVGADRGRRRVGTARKPLVPAPAATVHRHLPLEDRHARPCTTVFDRNPLP